MSVATFSVLGAFIDSDQSLTRSLSPVDRFAVERSPAIRKRPLFSRRKPPLHPPACQFCRRSHPRELQKAIQHPETRSGSVQ